MPELDKESTVARIVAENPSLARVFQKHGIDYCCHGDVTVPEACQEARLDPEAVFGELEAVLGSSTAAAETKPSQLSDTALIAHIVERHHGYLRRALPYVLPVMAKVAQVHASRDAKLERLEEAVRSLAANLVPHLAEEEEVLFPMLLSRARNPTAVKASMAKMREEHLAVGALLAQVRKLTDGFAVPEWGCNTYRVLMGELAELEADILRHVHLENHVLAPRFEAIAAGRYSPSRSPETKA